RRGVGEAQPVEMRRRGPSRLRPGLAAVRRRQDRAVQADGPAPARADELDPLEDLARGTRLDDPTGTGVRGMEDRPLRADRPAGGGVGEEDAVEVAPGAGPVLQDP